MTMTAAASTDARVWIACLACYNDGRLVGDWFPAIDADDVTLDDVHARDGGTRGDCEELWVFDLEGLPLVRECSPMDAAEWARVVQDVPEWQRDALLAWVSSGDYIAEGYGDLPSLSDFEEAHAGHWDSLKDYAESLLDDTGMWAEIPEWARAYFDIDKYVRDLAHDFTTEPATDGGVHVFRSL